jgi:hypothetical protein
MSTTPTYINQRINNLQSQINSIISGGVPTTSNLADVLVNGNSAGSTDIDMNSQDILQVNNIDLVNINGSAYPPVIPVDNLQAVLTAGNTATGSVAKITLTNSDAGGGANPILTLNNTNTGNNSVALEIYKNRTTGASNGDTLFQQSVYGKDSFLNKQEYTRITHTIRDLTGGAEDGSIEFGCFVNGSNANFLQLNGNQNEVNCLKTLDMESNNILTDAKIATKQGFPSNLGSSIDFVGATPDLRFTLDNTKIELHYTDSANYSAFQTIFQDNANDEAYFKQTFLDVVASQTAETIIQNDINGHLIKLDDTTGSVELTPTTLEFLTTAGATISNDGDINITCVNTTGAGAVNITAGGSNSGTNIITLYAPYGNVDITSGADLTLSAPTGDILITGSTLQFNNVNILPRRFYSSLAFSVSGSPTGTIFNTGNLADMVAFTTWKVEVAFYTTAINTRNALTYQALDTTNTDSVGNSVFGYANSGFQTAIQFDPAGTPSGTYCSFVDTFEVSPSAIGDCSFVLTGGTADGSTWSGSVNVSIVLTRLS